MKLTLQNGMTAEGSPEELCAFVANADPQTPQTTHPQPTKMPLDIKFNGSHDFGSRRTTATRAFDILMTIPCGRFVRTGDPMVERAMNAGISLPAGARQAVTTAIVNLVKLGLITRKRGNKFFVTRTDVDDSEAIKIIDNTPSVFAHG